MEYPGSGGLGGFVIQFAKVKGADVYTTTGTNNKGGLKSLGQSKFFELLGYPKDARVVKVEFL